MLENLRKLNPDALPFHERVAIASVFACLLGAADADMSTKLAQLAPLLDWFEIDAAERQQICLLALENHDATSFAAAVSHPAGQAALLWDLLVLAMLGGRYDSRNREGIRRVSTAMGIPWRDVVVCEDQLTSELREFVVAPRALASAASRRNNRWKIAAAALCGGALLAFTGGMAAPAIGGAVGTYFMGLTGAAAVSGGLASLGGGALAAGGLGMAGGTAAIASLLGLGGAAMAGSKMRTLTGGLEEFNLEPLGGDGAHVAICVSGWLSQGDDFATSWNAMSETWPHGQHYALRWESKHLHALGTLLATAAGKNVAKAALSTWAKRASRAAANTLTWPLAVVQSMDLIDNPWHVAAARAKLAGIELGKSLREGAVGRRPVSLYGFSLGARLIFHALEELRRTNSIGIIDHVVLMGGAVTAAEARWDEIRKVASGRFVNAYCETDWVLAYLYRAAEAVAAAAGLGPIAAHGVENIDVTSLVGGHLGYRVNLGALLMQIGIDRGPADA